MMERYKPVNRACVSSVIALYYRVETAQKPDVMWYLDLVCLAA